VVMSPEVRWFGGLNTRAWWSQWMLPSLMFEKLPPPSDEYQSSWNPM
jgi:hypothetical protein